MKVEQITGLPMLTVNIDRAATGALRAQRRRRAGGRRDRGRRQGAGQVFEGDRRFEIVVRLPEHLRADLDALRRLPIPLPKPQNGAERAGDPSPT